MNTVVLIALVGLALAASYDFPFSEDEAQASENNLEETSNDFPSERKVNQAIEEDLDGMDYRESHGREDEENTIQNDVDNFMEGEMDGAFNDLVEQVSDPRRRRRLFRRSRYRRRGRRRFRRSRYRRRGRRLFRRSRYRRRRRRGSRRRYCIRLPGACRK